MACRLRVLVVDTPDRILPLKSLFLCRNCSGSVAFIRGVVFLSARGSVFLDTWLMFVVFIHVGGPLRDTLLSKVE